MKKIIVFFILFIILIISYKNKSIDTNSNKDNIVFDKSNISNNKIIKISYNNEISNIDLEEYVLGVVACEMPSSFELEALKAMAVAARTFALYKLNNNSEYVMKTSTSDQCYIDINKMKKNWGSSFNEKYNKIKLAVEETSSEFLTYNDEIIISFYFSISNGYTENCENVFSQKLNYLVSVDSSWDKNYNYKENEVILNTNEFLKKININDNNIKSISYDRSNTGRVNYIYINGNKYKGTKFRNLLSLRSTDFEIEYDNSNVKIITKGYGHGVGMSQYGANYMANNGYTYDEILKYYYTGVKIMNN